MSEDRHSVRYHSKARRLRVLYGYSEDGKPLFVEFTEGVAVVSEPEQVECVELFRRRRPSEVWLEEGQDACICEICWKVCKSQFALDGHRKSHGKKVE